jgi:hypothetical protein
VHLNVLVKHVSECPADPEVEPSLQPLPGKLAAYPNNGCTLLKAHQRSIFHPGLKGMGRHLLFETLQGFVPGRLEICLLFLFFSFYFVSAVFSCFLWWLWGSLPWGLSCPYQWRLLSPPLGTVVSLPLGNTLSLLRLTRSLLAGSPPLPSYGLSQTVPLFGNARNKYLSH